MTSPTVFLDERYMLRPEYETRNYDLATDSRTMDFPASGIKIAGTAIDITAAEANYLDLTTLGTGAASKAVVLDSGEDYTWPATGVLTVSLLTANADPFVLTGLLGSASAGGAITVVGGAGAGAGNAGGAYTLTTGAGIIHTTGTGGAGGAVTITSGVAGGCSTGTGGAGGAITLTGVAGGAASGDGTGGAGSAITMTGGIGGVADANTGTEIGGRGGTVTLTAGAGGSADSKTGGEGGNVILQAGAAGETTEIEGAVYLRGSSGAGMPVFFKTQIAFPAAVSTDATLTVAQVFSQVIVIDDGGSATSTQTLPTGTAMSTAAPPDIAAGDSFYLHVVNEGTTAAELAVIATATGFVLQGSGTIVEQDSVENASSAMFLVRFVSTNNWTCTRVA